MTHFARLMMGICILLAIVVVLGCALLIIDAISILTGPQIWLAMSGVFCFVGVAYVIGAVIDERW